MMDIKKISEIESFYTHFLVKIRQLETRQLYRKQPTDFKKSKLSEWLTQHKSAKTFGKHVRHEIFHMLELLKSDLSIPDIEKNIVNLEINCRYIRLKMEFE